jgi:eukaryotic-like serine/threonine-protein kinase
VKELGDRALDHLRELLQRPDFEGTRYELGRELARGGMGVVYAARDRELGREVAVKVVAAEMADPETVARLRREARIIAHLEHPGIVPVHDVGTLPDGRVFYAMKLVSGKRLDALMSEGPPLGERLRLFLRICEAVAFAHAHGVIHRDLKPENVMVGAFGEVLVVDWGVAKHREEIPATEGSAAPPSGPRAEHETAHGTILGTPAYMAPEQARGEIDRVDARADVYALGALLYFLLTGRAPGRTKAGPDDPTRTWAGTSRPSGTEPPRRIAPGIARSLEAICLKALAPDPEGRYPKVDDLAADVGLFLEGERVSAYPENAWQRARRFATRHRTAVALVLAYLVTRIVLLLVARV